MRVDVNRNVLSDAELDDLHGDATGYQLLSVEAIQCTTDAVEAKGAKAEDAIEELGVGAFLEALSRRGYVIRDDTDTPW